MNSRKGLATNPARGGAVGTPLAFGSATLRTGTSPRMLRITRTDDAGRTLLKLEGKLLAAWSAELLGQVPRAEGALFELRLDLTGITFVDDAGRALLHDLISRGASVSGCSGYLSELLHV